MINNIVLLATLFLALLHVFIKRHSLNKNEIVDLLLIYFIIGGIGVVGGLGFICHVFFPDWAAKMIGWPTGSPFQLEVGFHDGAWALLAFLCLYYRDHFWNATCIGWSFFLLGAAFGHINQTLLAGNFAPYNAGMILPDILIPVILLSLLYCRTR